MIQQAILLLAPAPNPTSSLPPPHPSAPRPPGASHHPPTPTTPAHTDYRMIQQAMLDMESMFELLGLHPALQVGGQGAGKGGVRQLWRDGARQPALEPSTPHPPAAGQAGGARGAAGGPHHRLPRRLLPGLFAAGCGWAGACRAEPAGCKQRWLPARACPFSRAPFSCRPCSLLQYNDGTPVLKHVSFTVPGGSTVALVGATGSGACWATVAWAGQEVPGRRAAGACRACRAQSARPAGGWPPHAPLAPRHPTHTCPSASRRQVLHPASALPLLRPSGW